MYSGFRRLVTHINDGFDFPGFNLRKYQGNLLIKPSEQCTVILE
jgi:RNA-directed DNA polymerase